MHKKKRVILICLGILINLFIWLNSLLPATESSNLSGGITGFINQIIINMNIKIELDTLSLVIRKLAHFTEFFILGFIWYFIFNSNKKNIYTLSYGLAVALIDEFIQYFIPGRHASMIDVLIDFSGVLFSVITFICIKKLIKHDE